MRPDHILISVSPGETRIAYLNRGQLIGLEFERTGRESRVGDIYVGRVEAVIHNLQAAFVDIGLARSGFLALPEARSVRTSSDKRDDAIGNYVKEGDAVVVQVLRDAEEDKGPKVTVKASLSGRDLVYTPGQTGVVASRRIHDPEERQRLSKVIEAAAGDDGGFILRTAAQEAVDEDLVAETERLRDRWSAIEAAAANTNAPALVYRNLDAATRVLREFGSANLERIIVDDGKTMLRIKAYATAETPDLVEILEVHDGSDPLFDAYGIEELIDAALSPVVALSSGGSLIISETPALIAIDVNTGSAGSGGREQTALDVNREAAAEIARQVRIRNLSGLLVIDFIRMRRDKNRDTVLSAFRQALTEDAQQPQVIGFTALGLVEMTRRCQGASLSKIVCLDPADGYVKSPLTTALEALRGVLREAAAKAAAELVLEVSPVVARALSGAALTAFEATKMRLGGGLKIVSAESLASDAFRVKRGGGA